jgi:hypothetical protein
MRGGFTLSLVNGEDDNSVSNLAKGYGPEVVVWATERREGWAAGVLEELGRRLGRKKGKMPGRESEREGPRQIGLGFFGGFPFSLCI